MEYGGGDHQLEPKLHLRARIIAGEKREKREKRGNRKEKKKEERQNK